VWRFSSPWRREQTKSIFCLMSVFRSGRIGAGSSDQKIPVTESDADWSALSGSTTLDSLKDNHSPCHRSRQYVLVYVLVHLYSSQGRSLQAFTSLSHDGGGVQASRQGAFQSSNQPTPIRSRPRSLHPQLFPPFPMFPPSRRKAISGSLKHKLGFLRILCLLFAVIPS
jgi:hypothetical protein